MLNGHKGWLSLIFAISSTCIFLKNRWTLQILVLSHYYKESYPDRGKLRDAWRAALYESCTINIWWHMCRCLGGIKEALWCHLCNWSPVSTPTHSLLFNLSIFPKCVLVQPRQKERESRILNQPRISTNLVLLHTCL